MWFDILKGVRLQMDSFKPAVKEWESKQKIGAEFTLAAILQEIKPLYIKNLTTGRRTAWRIDAAKNHANVKLKTSGGVLANILRPLGWTRNTQSHSSLSGYGREIISLYVKIS